MRQKDYLLLKRRIVPQLAFNQTFYEEAVTQHVSQGTVWLDAGCGKHILPPWRGETERTIVTKARLAIGCDADHQSLREHQTLSHLVTCDLEHLPFRPNSMSLITCNMVVEHLERPLEVFAEFARILRPKGELIVHTPNAYSHVVFGSRLIRRCVKLRLVKALDGREEHDIFRTRYRANSSAKLQRLMACVGLKLENCRMLASEAALQGTHPVLVIPELLYIRMTLRPALRYLRASILAIFTKAEGRRPSA